MSNRLHRAVQYLAEQFSVSRDEFRRDNTPGGEMLMEALISQGYANQRDGRLALSRAGERLAKELEHATA